MATPTSESAHADLHSDQGALRGEHPGRARNPVIKVIDLAWLEFEKPDLHRARTFAEDFGFTVAAQTPDALYLRGSLAGGHGVVIRRGPRARYLGAAFRAQDEADLRRLSARTGALVRDLTGPGGGRVVDLRDPSGLAVRVVAGTQDLPALPERPALTYNFGGHPRTNVPQRPAREPAMIQRLGHVVLQTTVFRRALDWYLEHLGLIASDFLYLPGRRDEGPTMAFLRCDRGSVPADHHTLALVLGPRPGYVHSAYQVTDLDAIAAGGEYLLDRGYRRTWGIGRHIQGSQLFDYWHDPDRLMVEHFADGDMFAADLEPGWAEMSASGLSQWGPPVTQRFLETRPSPELARAAVAALRGDNELDVRRLLALAVAMSR